MSLPKKSTSKLSVGKPTRGYPEGRIPNRMEQDEAASYIASIGVSLQDIAESADLHFLSYLISLVVEEARQAEAKARKENDEPSSAA